MVIYGKVCSFEYNCVDLEVDGVECTYIWSLHYVVYGYGIASICFLDIYGHLGTMLTLKSHCTSFDDALLCK